MSDQPEIPKDQEDRRERWLKIGAITFVAVVFVGAFLIPDGSTGADEGDAERVCRESVEARLKAPSTADFRGSMASEADGRWTVRGEVDAENSFGAAIRNTYVCMLEPTDGGDLSLVDIEISE